MHTLISTGNGGVGSALVAAATASAAAQSGRKTMLASIGPSHSLGALVGVPLSSAPMAVAPNLDAWELDAPADLGDMLEQIRPKLFGPLAHLSSDELPLILGIDFFLCVERVRQAAAAGYDLAVIDAGPHDALLRVLALPDSFRWLVRLMLGLDRGPGQSSQSVGRAMIPTSLLPFEWVGQMQEARTRFEAMRDQATAFPQTAVRYVLRPDAAGLDEARLAVPALHLHGLAVDALVVGPLIPADVADARLTGIVEQQQAIIAEAESIWSPRPILRLPMSPAQADVGHLASLGYALYGEHAPDHIHAMQPPIEHGGGAQPFVAISLPGIQREALHLTISGDELIVRAGPYRRHLLLPDSLRGKGNIRASREGERLIVRLRQS
jgi:anion-transporting  ArsA/GET3 family ATPase